MVFGVYGSVISLYQITHEKEDTYFHSSDIDRFHEQGGCSIAHDRKFAQCESPSGQTDTDIQTELIK
jgi:hypothetical protein